MCCIKIDYMTCTRMPFICMHVDIVWRFALPRATHISRRMHLYRYTIFTIHSCALYYLYVRVNHKFHNTRFELIATDFTINIVIIIIILLSSNILFSFYYIFIVNDLKSYLTRGNARTCDRVILT